MSLSTFIKTFEIAIKNISYNDKSRNKQLEILNVCFDKVKEYGIENFKEVYLETSSKLNIS